MKALCLVMFSLLLTACGMEGASGRDGDSERESNQGKIVYIDAEPLERALAEHVPVPVSQIVAASISDVVLVRHDLVAVELVNHLESQGLQANVSLSVDELELPEKQLSVAPERSSRVKFELSRPLTGEHRIKVFIEYEKPSGLLQWERSLEFTALERLTKVNVADFGIASMVEDGFSIDGDLEEWEELSYLFLEGSGAGQQLTAKLYLAWDEGNFYLAAEVNDKKHINTRSGSGIWDGDSFQFAFDPVLQDVEPFNLGLALASGRIQSHQWGGPETELWENSEYIVRRDDEREKTYYEMKIPFEKLKVKPESGLIFAFNAIVFEDHDGDGYDYWIELTPGLAGGWDPGEFRNFILLD